MQKLKYQYQSCSILSMIMTKRMCEMAIEHFGYYPGGSLSLGPTKEIDWKRCDAVPDFLDTHLLLITDRRTLSDGVRVIQKSRSVDSVAFSCYLNGEWPRADPLVAQAYFCPSNLTSDRATQVSVLEYFSFISLCHLQAFSFAPILLEDGFININADVMNILTNATVFLTTFLKVSMKLIFALIITDPQM